MHIPEWVIWCFVAFLILAFIEIIIPVVFLLFSASSWLIGKVLKTTGCIFSLVISPISAFNSWFDRICPNTYYQGVIWIFILMLPFIFIAAVSSADQIVSGHYKPSSNKYVMPYVRVTPIKIKYKSYSATRATKLHSNSKR